MFESSYFNRNNTILQLIIKQKRYFDSNAEKN